MTAARGFRRCALQALYQLDAHRGASVDDELLESVRASLEESTGGAAAHAEGFELARRAWALRTDADAAVETWAPEWPAHRQPAVDRSILRLAYCEIVEESSPPKVVINEAVELAREFSTERSPLFVNAVLDKIYKARIGEAVGPEAEAGDGEGPATSAPAVDVPDAAPPAPETTA